MGEALLGGVLSTGWAEAAEVAVVEPSAERRAELAARHRDLTISSDVQPEVDAIIAVKPEHVPKVAQALGESGAPRLLSVAAGVTIATMEAAAPEVRVVRCMPNTPALVGAGASAIAGGSRADEADLVWAESILGAVGIVVRVEEPELDAVTGLSGSGPAYVFHLAEALMAAGRAQGLAPDIADLLTRQTLLGAARLLSESGEQPSVLRKNVTSPGGTTAAGLAVFEKDDLMGIIDRVVAAAVARSVELGAD